MKYKTHIKLVNELYDTCFQYNEGLRVNHLTPLLVETKCPTLVGSCGGHILLRTSNDIFIFNLGLRFERLF